MLGDLGKLIVVKDFKKLPKVQKIARSGHTGLVRVKALVYWLREETHVREYCEFESQLQILDG